MSKILFIFERDMPTISIMREIYKNLAGYKEIQPDFQYLTDVTPFMVDSHDVIVLLRPNDVYSWKIAKSAHKAGHTVVTFCDDDLLNLPGNSPTIPWRKKGLLKALRQSDVIWSSSRWILQKYNSLTAGGRTALQNTVIQPSELEGVGFHESNSGIVKIVYAAAPSHVSLFERFITPVTSKLADEFGDRIQFTFISVHPNVEKVGCSYLNGMPLDEYRRYMREQQFDIGVAPLNNDDFSKCKYFNKFIEYTTQGTVGVYSNVEPYSYVVKDKVNGFLCDDTPESWYQALRTAINEKGLRKTCLENAVGFLRTNLSEKAVMDSVVKDIPEFLNADGSYEGCSGFGLVRLKYFLSKPFDWAYLVLYNLKKKGVGGLVKQIKSHFKEAKAYRRRK
ncbi:MAG: hypothetical protein ILP16_07105 [Spirochaetales bacterium]|nr:hypothetical protein [Spirochaetales bacterium]